MGDPTPSNSMSSGNTTGRSASGTGTAPQSSQLITGNGSSPVALPGHTPIAQAIVGLARRHTLVFEQFSDTIKRRSEIHSVQWARVDAHAVFGDKRAGIEVNRRPVRGATT